MLAVAGVLGALVIGAAACGGAGGGAAPGGAGAGAVPVSLKEFTITVGGTAVSKTAKATVKAGSVSFNVSNDGAAPHGLTITGNGVNATTGSLDPGAKKTLTVNLKAGSYEVYCPVDGHKQLGMDGTVVAQ